MLQQAGALQWAGTLQRPGTLQPAATLRWVLKMHRAKPGTPASSLNKNDNKECGKLYHNYFF